MSIITFKSIYNYEYNQHLADNAIFPAYCIRKTQHAKENYEHELQFHT